MYFYNINSSTTEVCTLLWYVQYAWHFFFATTSLIIWIHKLNRLFKMIKKNARSSVPYRYIFDFIMKDILISQCPTRINPSIWPPFCYTIFFLFFFLFFTFAVLAFYIFILILLKNVVFLTKFYPDLDHTQIWYIPH